ncbi:MAG: hypothetical protein HUK11_02160 [Muribaculaceae bacterium]|nr:hypothetical protein [Muribaculaceae bacterium]
MADNYLENRHNDWLKYKERKEAQRKHRLHKALLAYRKRLAQQKAASTPTAGSTEPPQK